MSPRRVAALLALAAAGALALLPAAARADDPPDTTPPAVTSLTVTPTAVDVTLGAQAVTVDATITDATGVGGWAYARWSSPSGGYSAATYLYPTGGDHFSGTINVQRYVQPGDWHLDYLYTYDTVGNTLLLNSAAAVAAAGLDAPIAVTSTEDASPPQFVSVTPSPTSVSITSSAATVNISAEITDDASGVQWAQVAYASPSGAHSATANLSHGAGNTWTGTLTIPQWIETGNWHVYYLYAGDGVGRYGYTGAAAAAAAGLDTPIAVTGISDDNPPVFQAVSVTPTAVDDGGGARPLHASVTITDDVSGVSSAQIQWSSPSGYTAWTSLTHSTGDVWTGTATVPQFAEAGVWHVSYLLAYDNAGRFANYWSASQIAAAGLDAPVTVTDTPELPVHHFKVRAAPSSVAAGDDVTLTITAQDSINQTVTPYAGPVTLTDLSGSLAVTSLTWSNGVGTALVHVPGPYHADQVTVNDGTGLSAAPTGTSNTFNVVGPVDHMTVRLASSSFAVGSGVTATVSALDSLNQPVPGFVGPVTLTDLSGALSIVSPLAWSSGVGTATVSVGSSYHADRLTAAAGGVPSASSPTFNVVGAFDHFQVRVAPTTAAAGSGLAVTVTAQDALNQTVPGYADPVTFGDLSGSLSTISPISWTAGVGTATVSVGGAYHADKVTATDASGATGTSNTFNVVGPADHFLVRVSPTAVSTGGQVTVTVTAQDSLNQTVTSYSGAVTFSDLSGSLSTVAAIGWTAGVGTATVSVGNAYHADRVTATGASGTAGSSNTFNVAGPATHLIVRVSPASVLVRGAVTVTVTALDATNQTAVGFSGSPLSFSDLSGNLLVVSSATWSGGIGTATIKVTAPYHADRVSIYDWWTGFTATSNTFNVV